MLPLHVSWIFFKCCVLNWEIRKRNLCICLQICWQLPLQRLAWVWHTLCSLIFLHSDRRGALAGQKTSSIALSICSVTSCYWPRNAQNMQDQAAPAIAKKGSLLFFPFFPRCLFPSLNLCVTSLRWHRDLLQDQYTPTFDEELEKLMQRT